jgi:hypothetical protein
MDGRFKYTSVDTLFIIYFCRICQRKRKEEKKALLPGGVLMPRAHTVLFLIRFPQTQVQILLPACQV